MTSAAPYDVSIVTAVHDVARYLPDFFASLEAQRDVDLGRVEIVAVDDGSNDDSLAVLERYRTRFAERGILPMQVIHQANAGQGPARNRGIDHAGGEWLTFTDPDDMLDPGYLASVLAFVAAHPEVEMVATNRVVYLEVTGETTDTHALRGMFAGPDRVVDLDRAPTYFHGHVGAGFVRRDRLAALGLRFDGRVRPNFEDGHFCTKYLLGCPAPTLGLVGSAKYVYRQRADGSSTMQRSFMQPERYVVVPRRGYLDVLEHARAVHGRVPEWVQNFVLYELSWLFSAEAGHGGTATAAVGDVGREFVGLLREIRALLDPHVIDGFRVRWLDAAWRQILLHGLGEEPWRAAYAVADEVDVRQNLARVVVRWTGPEPAIEYLCDGAVVEPTHTKVRSVVFFDHALLHERIAWLPADTTNRVRVDGRYLELRPWWTGAAPTTFETDPPPRRAPDAPPAGRSSVWHATRRRAVEARRGHEFDGAWVLMDRITDADDNAERLFEYLRENRPDINAWFTVAAGTPDHARLAAGRHGDRVVAHGSPEWEVLMLHCRHLVSSHVDVPVHRPPQILRLLGTTVPPWRFTFLQHGVIKDDLSGWLNSKQVDLFVTSTQDEYDSVAGDGTSYVYTGREVRLTGLPRFDRLRRIARSVAPQDRTMVLVAPTWRQWLQKPRGSDRTVQVVDDFFSSEYVEQWSGLLRSPELADTLARNGLQLGFLPHPNLQHVLPQMELPAHVTPLTFEGAGVQRLFASAAALVTDYSSMAFNAAYVDRPVLYFQFDHDRVMAGGHLGRAGYFTYPTHGFGPVTRTLPDTVAALTGIVGAGCVPAPQYADRISRTFPARDGRCCERVTAEIERLDQAAPRAPRRASDRPVVPLRQRSAVERTLQPTR
ncbi:MAG: CDP-glycerol glycerophosphotransferase family protein [Actinobacteria bacterium]|nr:CDP-glycerol glycerophosphotransferase family protein [Actinomycetota bacterium]